MKNLILPGLLMLALMPGAFSQCKIALDTLDEFDTTRLIASEPMKLGYFVATGNVAEDFEGKEYTEEAKAIFSFANENKIRSFFLTLGVVERTFSLIDPDYTVMLKFSDGNIVRLLNVPDKPEFDRNILMWQYVHTCVVPLEIFQMLKNTPLEKIRINYKDFKTTIALDEKQQTQLIEAVRCVEERLAKSESAKP